MIYAGGMTYWQAFLPGLIIILVSFAVLPWLDRESQLARSLAVAVCLFFSWRYMVWRIAYTLPPIGFTPDFVSGIIFLAIELLATIGGTLSLIFLTKTRNRTAEVERNLPWLASLPAAPLVDVLICTYNEDERILERTIIGALSIDYPNYRLWVCDDGRRPWLKALCDSYGCGYITRPDSAHAKAGNINNALRYVGSLPEKPDYISILDADFVPKTKFLTRAMSLMREDDVGVVQTPQYFFNPDPIQTNLALSRVWPDEQRYFFEVVMPSKDAWGGAFCCGTSSLIRFEPLARIGGFPTDSVTEDYLLSLRLDEIGFRTVYLNEPLSLGLAPEGLKDYIGQRSRWALGFIQICRGKSGPLSFHHGISLVNRLMMIETFLYWSMTFTFRLAALIVPALYLLFNVQAVYANVTEAVYYVVPHFTAQIAVVMWISRARVLPVLCDLSQLLCADSIVRSVAIGLFNSKEQKFKVTAKGYDRGRRTIQWPLLRSFLFYLAFTMAGIAWAFVIDDTRPLADAAGMALGWSWYNIIVLVLASFVTVEASERRAGNRFRAEGVAQLEIDGKMHRFDVADISVSGMRLKGKMPAPVGTPVQISYDSLLLDAKIARAYQDAFALHFETSPVVRTALVRYLYCGKYGTGVTKIDPKAVASALAGRIFR